MEQVESALLKRQAQKREVSAPAGFADESPLRLVMMHTIFLELIAAALIKAESAALPLQSVVI